MAHELEKERRWRLREHNAFGAVVGLMFLGLVLIGGVIAFLLAPALVTTVPPALPGQEERTTE